MLEFFTTLYEAIQADPALFLATISSYAGLTAGFVGSVVAVVKGIKAIFQKVSKADLKLNEKLNTLINGAILPLNEKLNEIKDSLENVLNAGISEQNEAIQGYQEQLSNIETQLGAFSTTVLNTPLLAQEYSNNLKQLTADKVEEVPEIVAEIDEAVEEAKPKIKKRK